MPLVQPIRTVRSVTCPASRGSLGLDGAHHYVLVSQQSVGGGALMAIALDWPSAVVTAAALKFKTPVSGVLWLPEIEYPCLTGRVFMDLSGRFADGRLIRTSEVRELIQEGDYTIARTCGRSHHLLVEARGNSFAVLRRLPRVRPFLIGSVH